VTVYVVCDKTLKKPYPMQFAQGMKYERDVQGPTGTVSHYTFVLAAAEGCSTEKPFLMTNIGGHSISLGSIFLIIVSVVTFIYCTVGMFYKYKKLGVSGLEAVPNIEFWRDLPGLVKDGLVYTFSKIRACAAPGGSSGGGSRPSHDGGPGYSTV